MVTQASNRSGEKKGKHKIEQKKGESSGKSEVGERKMRGKWQIM